MFFVFVFVFAVRFVSIFATFFVIGSADSHFFLFRRENKKKKQKTKMKRKTSKKVGEEEEEDAEEQERLRRLRKKKVRTEPTIPELEQRAYEETVAQTVHSLSLDPKDSFVGEFQDFARRQREARRGPSLRPEGQVPKTKKTRKVTLNQLLSMLNVGHEERNNWNFLDYASFSSSANSVDLTALFGDFDSPEDAQKLLDLPLLQVDIDEDQDGDQRSDSRSNKNNNNDDNDDERDDRHPLHVHRHDHSHDYRDEESGGEDLEGNDVEEDGDKKSVVSEPSLWYRRWWKPNGYTSVQPLVERNVTLSIKSDFSSLKDQKHILIAKTLTDLIAESLRAVSSIPHLPSSFSSSSSSQTRSGAQTKTFASQSSQQQSSGQANDLRSESAQHQDVQSFNCSSLYDRSSFFAIESVDPLHSFQTPSLDAEKRCIHSLPEPKRVPIPSCDLQHGERADPDENSSDGASRSRSRSRSRSPVRRDRGRGRGGRGRGNRGRGNADQGADRQRDQDRRKPFDRQASDARGGNDGRGRGRGSGERTRGRGRPLD